MTTTLLVIAVSRSATPISWRFVTLVANHLIAMALRMTMRIWEQGDPWLSAEAFCRGYACSARLSTAEAAQLPQLFRLRAAMGILWALGRGVPIDAPRLLEHVGYLRNTARWLDRNGARLAALAARTLTDEGGL